MMDILISIFAGSDSVPQRLRKDGWQLAASAERSFIARHPRVSDEPEARLRLQKLGLLTSRGLRIEFAVKSSPEKTAEEVRRN